MTGETSFHKGLSAEDLVARHYQAQGYRIAHRRWRGAGGEIDLICQRDDGFVFVEVKASRTKAGAAARILPRQIKRLQAAASEYLGTTPGGQNSAARFDVALVDAKGQLEVIENAFGQ